MLTPIQDVVRGDCHWAPTYQATCGTGEIQLAVKSIYVSDANVVNPEEKLCCKDPSLIHDCRWEHGEWSRCDQREDCYSHMLLGQKGLGIWDCVNANCKPEEVQVDQDDYGDGAHPGCSSCTSI
jgi:hypothetical protein